MDTLKDYRHQLLERYQGVAEEFRQAVKQAADPLARTSDSDWTVHQIAAHTRDVERDVYGVRIRRTLEEDNPIFDSFDADAHMAEHYRPEEPLDSILDELVTLVHENVQRLRSLPAEAWSRPSRHVVLGDGFTTQTWVERALAHIEEHLQTIRGSRSGPAYQSGRPNP